MTKHFMEGYSLFRLNHKDSFEKVLHVGFILLILKTIVLLIGQHVVFVLAFGLDLFLDVHGYMVGYVHLKGY